MLDSILMGLLSGSALLIGAFLGLKLNVKKKYVAAVMAFGAGVLISALSIDLMDDAFDKSKDPIVVGLSFLCGALVFVLGDYFIDKNGGKFRKGGHGLLEKEKGNEDNSGTAIFLGTLLDGIPESFVVGASIAIGGSTGLVFVAAVFLSNLPEGMSGTAGMKQSGMSNRSIILLWLGTLVITVLASVGGYLFLGDAPQSYRAATMAFASGAILAMLCDTMIPEAFKFGGRFVALITVVGFLTAFLLSKAL